MKNRLYGLLNFPTEYFRLVEYKCRESISSTHKLPPHYYNPVTALVLTNCPHIWSIVIHTERFMILIQTEAYIYLPLFDF